MSGELWAVFQIVEIQRAVEDDPFDPSSYTIVTERVEELMEGTVGPVEYAKEQAQILGPGFVAMPL